MKKIATLLAALMLMTAAFAGCGNDTGSSAAGTSSTASESSTTQSSETSQEASTEETSGSGETLVMATNAFFEPYEYSEGDEIVGIDAEIGKAIADKLGMDFEISDMEFDAIIPAIQNGKASIGMAGMTVTPDREKNVSFSQTYATGVQVIIVPEGSDIASADDLEGKKIGV